MGNDIETFGTLWYGLALHLSLNNSECTKVEIFPEHLPTNRYNFYLCKMKDTKSEIVRIADQLIRTKGYNAFSYTDISERLKIKNASIHYYFPSKSDLGVEVIKNTIRAFQETTDSWKYLDINIQFEKFVTMHDKTHKEHWVCLMGALSSSLDTLSDEMKIELKKMANMIIDYLTDLLTRGKEQKKISFTENPKTKAYLIQSSLLASLLLDKVMGNNTYELIQEGILHR